MRGLKSLALAAGDLAVAGSHPSRVRGLKYEASPRSPADRRVAPFTGAWIEILLRADHRVERKVAPFTGAWIEIPRRSAAWPSPRVAPFTGAWIEMQSRDRRGSSSTVAPFTGAWIEIC